MCPVCSAQLCAEPQPHGFGMPITLEQGMRELVQTLRLLQCAGQLCHCLAGNVSTTTTSCLYSLTLSCQCRAATSGAAEVSHSHGVVLSWFVCWYLLIPALWRLLRHCAYPCGAVCGAYLWSCIKVSLYKSRNNHVCWWNLRVWIGDEVKGFGKKVEVKFFLDLCGTGLLTF